MMERRLPLAVVDRPTWEALVRLEPQLVDMERRAREVDPSCDPLGQPYGQLKREVAELVGWGARCAELATSDAYDVTIHRIVDALELEGPP